MSDLEELRHKLKVIYEQIRAVEDSQSITQEYLDGLKYDREELEKQIKELKDEETN